ncbi:signal recognition particle binding protein [Cylindrobasidium torrendii FP15055 ss-10]|uniref:Signal recognition particle binding protein n=1 Tax=Cylindrobasidium torrendii FP15055 ss-10 TaxID=1314674 RepID=A0A0D7B9A0_9AGAR|nr:signal recognition particle binding protein [Cylindrobasidium torrendii FP15055 ss-10]
MLDLCTISHKGGLVLWSRSFTPEAAAIATSPTSPVNSLIREALIEGRSTEETYEKNGYAVKWTLFNDLELIFCVAYQRILQLTYVEELLDSLKTLFVELFRPFLTAFVASVHAVNKGVVEAVTTLDISKALEGWDKTFDRLLKGLEDKDRSSRLRTPAKAIPVAITPPSDDPSTMPTLAADETSDGQTIARNVEALKNRMRGRGGRRGGRGGGSRPRTPLESAPSSDAETPTKRKSKAKTGRKWGDEVPTDQDMDTLDYSMDKPDDASFRAQDLDALVDKSALGTTKDGMYSVADWEPKRRADQEEDERIQDILQNAKNRKEEKETSSSSTFGSLFARLTGSKTFTEADLQPVLEAMKQLLMKKNVAKDIADKVCQGVGENLLGAKAGSFQTTNSAVRAALSKAITRILTPKTSTDMLLSIRDKMSAPVGSGQQRTPYSITFVGVNGVGKSTNLSKVCFWLIQNGLRVLIAACDTFRSGAVEQLRVHVRNLSMLGVNGATDSKGRVELFEKGYGKDAAGIAKQAIEYAKEHDFDVVLIDTAGRMQDNEPLMRALAKLVSVNNPDKIIFVGEALVGNEAVDQLTKFDRALKDFSSAGSVNKGRGIDGMLVTKWDTVDDKVGAALSMTYVTGQPILFLGTGQTYTDLKQLRVDSVVQAIVND